MSPPRDDVLIRICDEKRAHIARRKVATPEAELIQRAMSAETPRGFMQALSRTVADGEYGLIAEIKKASPSRGLIRADERQYPEALAEFDQVTRRRPNYAEAYWAASMLQGIIGTWDQAFETLLKTHKLGYVAEGTIVRIAPLSVLAEEEGDRRKLAEAKALAGDLRVQTFSLSYAKAGDVSPLLVKSALSQRGQIQVDARTNTIIVTDLPDRLQTVSALLGALDRPEPQVEVEARVVQTTREFAKAIGVQWGLNGRVTPGIGNTTGLAFPNNGTLNGRTGAVNSPADNRATANDSTGTVVNLPVPGANSAIGLAVGPVAAGLLWDNLGSFAPFIAAGFSFGLAAAAVALIPRLDSRRLATDN